MLALWKMRMTGDETALRPGFCCCGVFRALRKPGCSRLASLEEKLPVARYHREMPGQMPHLDIMRLGKTEELGGIEKHACGKAIVAGRAGNIRACALMTRPAPPAYTAIFPDETAGSAVEFFWFAVAWHASHGIKVARVLADNGACCKLEVARCLPGIRHKTQTHTALSPASQR